MKSFTRLVPILPIAALLGASHVLAQPAPTAGAAGPGNQYGRMYNPQSVETISGQVEKVETAASPRGMGRGVHLLVKTDHGTLPVHLGPAWFIDNQEMQIQPKDQVQVTGSRVSLQGQEVLIASEVKDGSAVLKLRDESGIPVWAGWRRGSTGAAGGPGGMMMGRGMMSTNRMQQRQEMMAEMKAMDADLDKKLAQMNQAQGSAKVDAMAAVINDLVKERRLMHQRMDQMHERMMSHMRSMQPPMGGSEGGTSGGRSGSGSQPGKE